MQLSARKPWMAAPVALLLAGAPMQPVWADAINKSAFELYQQCETVTSRFLQGVCFGYLAATIASYRPANGDAGVVCPPANLRLETVRRDFIAFVADNQSLSDRPAHEAVIAAMRALYPCDGASPPAAGEPADPPDYGLSVGQD